MRSLSSDLAWGDEGGSPDRETAGPQSQPLSGQPNPGAHTLALHQPLGPILPHPILPLSPFPLAEVYKLGTIIRGKYPFPLSKVNPSRGEKYVKFLDTSSSLVFQMLKFTQRKRSGFLSKCTLPCPKGKNFVHKSNACHT